MSTNTSSTPRQTRGRVVGVNEAESDPEMEVDDLGMSDAPPARRNPATSTSRVLKLVAIPASSSSLSLQRGARVVSQTPSSMSSVHSSHRDRSSEYETPATSAVATPADLGFMSRPSKELLGITDYTTFGQKASNNKSYIASKDKGKRKRTIEDLENDDALLAQALQAEEYAEQEAPQAKRGRQQKTKIEDFEDDLEDLESLSSDPEFGVGSRSVSIKADRQKVKQIKTGGRISLPTRAARDSARKSIADKASLGIMDTDESELSDYSSEFDSGDLEAEDSELEDMMQPDDIAAAAIITAAASTSSNARPRAQQLAATARAGRPGGGVPTWTSRVSDTSVVLLV